MRRQRFSGRVRKDTHLLEMGQQVLLRVGSRAGSVIASSEGRKARQECLHARNTDAAEHGLKVGSLVLEGTV